jgi:hypothetical protein
MRTETLDPVATLRRQQMPPDEIRAVLAADDPIVVRRLLELHRERMEEWLDDQRRIVASLERALMGAGPLLVVLDLDATEDGERVDPKPRRVVGQ